MRMMYDLYSLLFLQFKLFLVSLETLGRLAEKFPDLSASVISSLKNFLVNPAPILLKLNKHYADHKCSRITTDMEGKSGEFRKNCSWCVCFGSRIVK